MSREKKFEKIVEKIQSKINFNEEKELSKKIITEYRNPHNFGVIYKPDWMLPDGTIDQKLVNYENSCQKLHRL